MPERKNNCPNCGAPRHGAKCEYCGTPFLFYAYAGEIPAVTIDLELTPPDLETLTVYASKSKRLREA